MSEERLTFRCEFDREFHFESYGVRIKIETDSQRLLDKARLTVENTFLGRALFIENGIDSTAHVFGIAHDGEHYFLYKNGEQVSYGNSEKVFFKYLNGILRIEVAEHTTSRIFVHAGVVGFKGQAIMIPGRSFQGKTTLTAELVRNGAEYYSDEYAVIDKNGFVHPFPRKLSMRYFGASREKEVTVEELGGKHGHDPLPVGMVLITAFKTGAKWEPEVLSPGNGIIEIVPHTIPIRQNAKFSLKVLDLVARRAIIVKSPRGDARKFAKFLLAFFDNHINLVKMT
jgi:hypothetical protein